MKSLSFEIILESLKIQMSKKLPFVGYRKPNSTTVSAMLQPDDSIEYANNFLGSGFIFAPFNADSNAILFNIDKCERIESEFTSAQKTSQTSISISTNKNEKKNHLDLIKSGIATIKSGELSKVVLSRRESFKIDAQKEFDYFISLLDSYETAMVYIWFHPKIGLWLGATPEKLIEINGRNLKTISLAGTRSANDLDAEWTAKEFDEQQLVTDFLVNKLGQFSSHIIKSEPITVRAGGLLHLKSEVTSRLDIDKKEIGPLIDAIHPTPAVCGLPKKMAMQYILENESYDREYYTGFLGEFNMQVGHSRGANKRNVENKAYFTNNAYYDLYVNLRCIKLTDSLAYIYVGGGITKDSKPEDEWQETVNKAMTMKSILG